ncbi:MAG TPA: DUF4124 domain-containing protein [Chromatiaceae bacterium]|nr:DUF4124 domain-containing protein [Chromatiaceae bacterium]
MLDMRAREWCGLDSIAQGGAMSRVAILVFLLFLAGTGGAVEVYRCVTADGSISFQQSACSHQGERIETGEAQAAWVGLRKKERQLYEQYRRRDRKRIDAQRKAERRNARLLTQAAPATCYNKRHSLNRVEAKLRSGYKPSKGESLRRKRDYLEGYLRRFCS